MTELKINDICVYNNFNNNNHILNGKICKIIKRRESEYIVKFNGDELLNDQKIFFLIKKQTLGFLIENGMLCNEKSLTFKSRTERIFSDIDPYGEEDWNEF